jgi:Chaperone of endosialidase
MNPPNKIPIPSFLIALILAVASIISLVPKTRAACDSPDPGCPGGNLAEGYLALGSLTTGVYNTGIGVYSLLSITDGSLCTGVGAGALFSNSAGENTATGAGALFSNGIGSANTANGAFALFSNTIGTVNTAIGDSALLSNTEGNSNTAVGATALFTNTTGSFNTANGFIALSSNTAGNDNTATGVAALGHNIDGNDNTANGLNALNNHTTGDANTAIGRDALFANTAGSNNTALGAFAGSSLAGNSNNNIDIGNTGVAFESDTIRIGSEFQTRTFIAAIRGVTTGIADAVNVVIDSNGQLGTISSSRRFKKQIKPMDQASESLLALKPVTFRYKTDKTNTPQFGLVAEDVAAVNPNLVVRDKDGKIYTVRYDAVNAMLLNEFLKEHNKVEALEGTVAALVATVREQASQIQKVNARLEVNKPAPQTALNSH